MDLAHEEKGNVNKKKQYHLRLGKRGSGQIGTLGGVRQKGGAARRLAWCLLIPPVRHCGYKDECNKVPTNK